MGTEHSITTDEIREARKRGAAAAATEPRAASARYDAEREWIVIDLTNGSRFSFPYWFVEGLQEATPEQLAEIEVYPHGRGLRWDRLDIDLGVPELIAAGAYGSEKWMRQELGRKGGSAKTDSKAAAARENGKKGGRPPRRKREMNIVESSGDVVGKVLEHIVESARNPTHRS
jgi:hypothetical protein